MDTENNNLYWPRVQVIMSTYNGEEFLREQVKSIFEQEECIISLMVRDDGSTDRTLTILEDLAKCYPIEIIKGENLKPAKSFLSAITMTNKENEFFALSDQDDVWKKDKIKSAIKKIGFKGEDDTPILYCSNLTVVNETLEQINSLLLPNHFSLKYEDLLIHSSNLFGCTMVFNRSMRNIVAKQLPKNPIMHDLWIGLLAALFGYIVYDSKSYILYRQHGNNQVGAQENISEKWKNRMGYFRGNHKGVIALQAIDILEYLKNMHCYDSKIWDYTKIVAEYNKSISNKIRYLIKVSKKGMTKKQLLFHVMLAMKGCL